jgi:four helix bundle protein
MTQKYLKLQDITAYKIAFDLSNVIWEKVVVWNYFSKDTVGKQLVRAVDSISANIAEGFGRYFKKDKINFYRYSYGSISESLDWIEKSKQRKLLPDSDCQAYALNLNSLFKEVHHLINFTEEKLTI